MKRQGSNFFQSVLWFWGFGIGFALILWTGVGFLEFITLARNQNLLRGEYLGLLLESGFYYALFGVSAFFIFALLVPLFIGWNASWRVWFQHWRYPFASALVFTQELYYSRASRTLLATDWTGSQILRANSLWLLYCLLFFSGFLLLSWALRRRLPQNFRGRIFKGIYLVGTGIARLLMISYLLLRPGRWLDQPYPAELGSARPQGPNVLLITIDALRPDHLPAYGYTEIKTPNLDQLVRESVLFENAYSSANNTFPSVISFLSSRYPDAIYPCEPALTGTEPDYRHRVKDPLNPEYIEKIMSALSPEILTLAEVLRAYHYQTGAILSNWFGGVFLFAAQGFDTFIAPAKLISWLTPTRRLLLRNLNPPDLFLLMGKAYGIYLHQQLEFDPHSAQTINQHAIKFLNQNPNKKFFLWLHYLEPHTPYGDPWNQSPPPLPGYSGPIKPGFMDSYLVASGELSLNAQDLKYIKYLYDYDLTFLDHALGELFEYLKKHQRWQNTIIIVTADHGEQFLEHGLLGHGFNYYEEEIRVPLIIKPHSRQTKMSPRRVSDPVSLIDLAPTILDLLEIPIPDSFQGKSLKNLMQAEPETQPRLVYSACSGLGPKSSALIQSNYKLIYRILPLSHTEKVELYNNLLDPQNQHDLSETLPEITAEMTRQIKNLIRENQTQTAKARAGKFKLRHEDLEELRALGYIK